MIAMVLVRLAATAVAATGGVATGATSGGVRLVVQRAAGAEGCPDGYELRGAVVRRLGFDPFDDAATREIRCSVRRDEGAFYARIQLASGPVSGSGGRELTSRRADCAELAEAM